MTHTFKTTNFTFENRAFRRLEVRKPDGQLVTVIFTRFIPETAVYRGLGNWEDRHGHWRMVNRHRHHKLYAKLEKETT